MDAKLTTACGRTLWVSVLEATTRTIYSDPTSAGACIALTSFGLQADEPVAAPATHTLGLVNGQNVTLNLAVCLELPAGGYFLTGDAVTAALRETTAVVGYAT
jgi:hypothetical protein